MKFPLLSLKKIFVFVNVCCIFSFVLMLSSCDKNDDNNNNNQNTQIHGTKAKPAWGATLTQQMQAVIESLDTIAPKPIYTLTPAEARVQPGAADAAMRVMNNYHIAMPAMNVDTVGKDIPVTGGQIHVRIYTPKTGKSSYPVVLYYHGGGWVIATIDTYNSSAQALAEQTDAIVVAVEYRKGPEYKFPTAHNDAYAGYVWALKNASTFKGDSTKMAVTGESAGGNMAVTVAMMARDSSIRKPLGIVSVYPVASNDPNTASKLQYADAEPLSTKALPWFLSYYLSDMSQSASPLISLVDANLSGLPPTTIIAAEIDPLQTEGKTLADKLSAANVTTSYKLYNGVTHEFFGMATVIPEAKDAESFAAAQLKAVLQ